MNQTYETGHAINVANLQKMIEQISVFGAYNPSVEELKKENLTQLYTKATEVLNKVEEKRTINKQAIHARQDAYEELRPTTTRIVNHLDILNLPDGDFAQAKSLNNLIHGNRKRGGALKKDPVDVFSDEPAGVGAKGTTTTVSTSRQSYTQLADNFSKLLQLLENIPSYNPNIEELKLEELKNFQTTMVESTKAVDQTEAELNAALIERNELLYAEDTGLYDIALDVKKYVKSVYGATAPEYTKVSGIKFTNP
ncbi:hypothetical protein OOZ15_16040 [Galbibacter sp. EGI 63066]|uniref:hypothetical protein n=1 Tax=Galbibacter sp. EGI 63066 TaxID=2993559 RepID=UPI002248F0A0|nr:hypothetical protein [Galbibacter sp. EGI 63066]MCX2681466.1 hypothetical protein [Galbibacter sp. EGI 63066]